ncbi:MAG: phage baseplate assembly protein V [Candidatus Sedimenticola sp. 6PFRAG7]
MSGFEMAELDRRIANLIRLGTVAEADYERAVVRVRSGELLTNWLPWLTRRAGNDRTWWAPEVGEQVVVLSPSGEIGQGVVLPALYQQAHPANGNSPDVMRVDFDDGACVEYNRKTHAMRLETEGTLTLKAARHVIVGPVVQSGGDMTSDGISAQHHIHPESIGVKTGEPQ